MSFFGQHPWWLLALAGIGAFALFSGFVTLFFALGRRPERIWTKEIGTVDSEDFIRPLAGLLGVPLREGGTAELINNGDAWLARLLEDLRAAERSITFSVYIWEPGRMADIILEVLAERASAGIEVRVLVDGLGGMRIPEDGVEKLRAAGGRVGTFRPFALGKISRFHRRNHRRAIVIDGRIAYTGGMAVGDKWLGDARNEKEWRDTMVRVTDSLAEQVQSAFAELWAYVTGEALTADSFFPRATRDTSDVLSLGIDAAPGSEDHPLRLFYYLSFLAARQRLWITTPYFVPDKHTRKVVADRAREGVDVRILVPNHHTDARPIRQAGHSYYQELLDAGVRIYEFQPTMLHAKHVVVDGLWSVVGSANMDIRSKELNNENVLGILDARLAGQLEEAFQEDLKRAVEIHPATWRQRGIVKRVIERLSVFFAEQY